MNLEEMFKAGDKVKYETSKHSKDNVGTVVSHKGDTVTVKHKDHLGAEKELEVHHSLVRKHDDAPAASRHKVLVTVSDPHHPAVTQRKEKAQRILSLSADSKESAVEKAKTFYKKKGLKVHDAEYHSAINEAKSTIQKQNDQDEKDGYAFHPTGKEGKNFATGTHVYEYEKYDREGRRTGERHWRDAKGNHYAESVEQIDELSKATLTSYAKKAEAEAGEHSKKAIAAWEKGDKETDEKHFKKMSARSAGAGMATYKASLKKEESETPVAPVPGMKWKDHAVMYHADTKQRVVINRKNVDNYPEHEGWKEIMPGQKVRKEETEQIDELSTSTLASYKKKAGADASASDKVGNFKKADKRLSGIIKATKKQFANDLKKEETELEEAARGVLHKVRVSYDGQGGRASANIKVHAPDKEAAKRYVVSDLSKKGHRNVTAHSARLVEERKSDPVPSVYSLAPESETRGTYHVHYHGTDKDGNKTTKVYKLKANTNHHAQSKAMKIARSEFPHHERAGCTTEKFFKEETVSFASYSEACDCSKVPAIKNAVKKLRQESIEVEEIEDELEDLQEASFSYFVKKAEDAKSKGNDKRFQYHMENARNARLGMTGKEMLRNRQHLDKYNELRNTK